jgi:hypothetical protein
MKFQSVVTPDGLFACMFGAVNGNRHDSFMLNQSLLLPRFRNLMPKGIGLLNHGGGGNTVFSLYADPAYPQSAYILGDIETPLQVHAKLCGMPICQVFANRLSGDSHT